MSQHNPYNANMIPGGYNGAANANPAAAAAANHYGAAHHHPQAAPGHNPVADMHAAAAAVVAGMLYGQNQQQPQHHPQHQQYYPTHQQQQFYHPPQQHQQQQQQAPHTNYHQISALTSQDVKPQIVHRPPAPAATPSLPPGVNIQRAPAPRPPQLQPRPPHPQQHRPPQPQQQRPNLPPGISMHRPPQPQQQRPTLPPGISMHRAPEEARHVVNGGGPGPRLPPGISLQKPAAPAATPNLPPGVNIQRAPAPRPPSATPPAPAGRPNLPPGISIAKKVETATNNATAAAAAAAAVSVTPSSGAPSSSGVDKLRALGGISISGAARSNLPPGISISGGGGGGGGEGGARPDAGAPTGQNLTQAKEKLQHLNLSISTPATAVAQPPKQPATAATSAPSTANRANVEESSSQESAAVSTKKYRPLVKHFDKNDANYGFDLSKVKMDPDAVGGPSTTHLSSSFIPPSRRPSSPPPPPRRPSTPPPRRPSTPPPPSVVPKPRPPTSSVETRDVSQDSSVARLGGTETTISAGDKTSQEDRKKSGTGVSVDGRKDPLLEKDKSGEEECQNKAKEELEKEPERGKTEPVNSKAEDEEMPQEDEEEADETTEAESEVEKAKGEAGGDDETEMDEADEEAVEEAGLVSDASGVEEEREEGEDEEMADADEGQTETVEEEPEMEEGQDENGNQADFDDTTSNTSVASPFKKPSGATNCDRKRHRSVDSSSNMSESSESSAVSSHHHKADRQAYQQQLAFYRTPMVGRETVCIFCLTKCTPDRDPKLLTCLHSSCAECFKERVDLAAGERRAMQCVDDDDVSAVQEDLTVACPLCKVSTSESEVVDNSFLSGEDTYDGNESQHYCTCDDNNPAHSWCAECEEHLCDDCVKAHQRVKVTRDHSISAIVAQPKNIRTSASSVATKEATCKQHKAERLSAFCENCDRLICRECQNSSAHEGHSCKDSHLVAPEVKSSLGQATDELRVKRTMLDENRSLLGVKLGELNIKERGLMTQLRDVKLLLMARIEAKFKELTNQVSKSVRTRRNQIEGRKSTLDRCYLQTDYALAFVEHALNYSDDDHALLAAKRSMERQMRRLKKVDSSTGLTDESRDFKMELYFERLASHQMHQGLEDVTKQVLSEIKLLSAPPPIPEEPTPSSSAPATPPSAQVESGWRGAASAGEVLNRSVPGTPPRRIPPPPQVSISPARRGGPTPRLQRAPMASAAIAGRGGRGASPARGAMSGRARGAAAARAMSAREAVQQRMMAAVRGSVASQGARGAYAARGARGASPLRGGRGAAAAAASVRGGRGARGSAVVARGRGVVGGRGAPALTRGARGAPRMPTLQAQQRGAAAQRMPTPRAQSQPANPAMANMSPLQQIEYQKRLAMHRQQQLQQQQQQQQQRHPQHPQHAQHPQQQPMQQSNSNPYYAAAYGAGGPPPHRQATPQQAVNSQLSQQQQHQQQLQRQHQYQQAQIQHQQHQQHQQQQQQHQQQQQRFVYPAQHQGQQYAHRPPLQQAHYPQQHHSGLSITPAASQMHTQVQATSSPSWHSPQVGQQSQEQSSLQQQAQQQQEPRPDQQHQQPTQPAAAAASTPTAATPDISFKITLPGRGASKEKQKEKEKSPDCIELDDDDAGAAGVKKERNVITLEPVPKEPDPYDLASIMDDDDEPTGSPAQWLKEGREKNGEGKNQHAQDPLSLGPTAQPKEPQHQGLKLTIKTDALMKGSLGSLSSPSKPVKIEFSSKKRNENGEERLRDVHTPPMMEGSGEHVDNRRSSKKGKGKGGGGGDGGVEGKYGDDFGNDEDWCAVCHDGGDTLYCCDRCPKVYHLFCYIPPLTQEPPDDWVCLMCATHAEIQMFPNKQPKNGGLGDRDLKTCRRILFELYNEWPQSTQFKECSDLNFKEYLQVIKEPIALDVIKERLSPDNPEHYSKVEEFLRDIRKMFKNCYKFHPSHTEFYQHAKELEETLDKRLEEWLPNFAYDQTVSSLPAVGTGSTAKKSKRSSSPVPGPSKRKRRDEGPDEGPSKKKKKKKRKKSKRENDDDISDQESISSSISEGERLDLLDALEKSLRDKRRAEAEEEAAKIEDKQEGKDDDFNPDDSVEDAADGESPVGGSGKGGKGKSSKNSRPKRSSARRS